MKTLKLLSISLLLVTLLVSCNLPDQTGSPTNTNEKKPVGTVVALTLQVNPTQIVNPTYTMPVATSPMPTFIPPNTPVWSVYNYTCELATGGGTMTMNLAWTDRSNSEESYKVYRDTQVIATLSPNSTFYVDTAFVATGKTLSYSVEAFNTGWQTSTTTITHGCQ